MMRAHIVDDSEYLPELSINLSRTLDKIGLNTLTVERRRGTFLFWEHMIRLRQKVLLEIEYTKYYFGSQVEGTTTPGLHSDIDTLWCSNYINVIQDLKEWEPGMRNLLMIEENVAPGYCRLQAIRIDKPMPYEDFRDERFATRDVSGRVIVKNSSLNEPKPEFNEIRHGPATTMCTEPEFVDKDIVQAYRNKTWPRQAEEFTRRKRRGSWPSKTLIQQAIKHGVFLVPVGHKLSSSEELEWRISPSMAERCLMFSLNIVQIKVYVALKMLMKTFVEPVVSDCISSYHCKTVVLYSIEQTASSFWREDNLVPCIRKCLYKLLNCIENSFCPHFIISEENLFDGKVTPRNRCTLISIISVLILETGRALICISIDGMGQHLQTRINSPIVDMQDSHATVHVVGDAESYKQRGVANSIKEFLIKINSYDFEEINAIELIRQVGVAKAEARLANDNIEDPYKYFSSFLLCWVGSVFFSNKFLDMGDTLHITLCWERWNISQHLKHACMYYCCQRYKAAETILNAISDRYNRHPIQPVCNCHCRSDFIVPTEICRMVYATITDRKLRNKTCSHMFAVCVMFSRQELFSTPNALRYEFFRSFGDEIKSRHIVDDVWMDLATVDCITLLYYLRYITNRRLKNIDLRKQSLRHLELVVKQNINVGHPETALNLLGTCFELEGDNTAAIACFTKSLAMFPTNNSANWHLSTLVYKLTTHR